MYIQGAREFKLGSPAASFNADKCLVTSTKMENSSTRAPHSRRQKTRSHPGEARCKSGNWVPRGGIGPAGAPGVVRTRHRHEDFRSGLIFSTSLNQLLATFSLPVCASKRQLMAANWEHLAHWFSVPSSTLVASLNISPSGRTESTEPVPVPVYDTRG